MEGLAGRKVIPTLCTTMLVKCADEGEATVSKWAVKEYSP